MRAVVYGPKSCGALGYLAEGFRARGHSVIFREDRQAYKRNYAEADKFDIAITDGLRAPMDLMRDEYEALGLPVIVTDLPYFRNLPKQHWQIGLNRLNWLPDFDCPQDRFDALGIELQPRVNGEHIVITGQKPMDASHGMNEAELLSLYMMWVGQIRCLSDRDIIFRPHPRAKHMRLEGVYHDIPTDTKNGGYEKLLQSAHAILTHVSTSGTEALIAGVPVFCHPSAQCAPVANTDLADIESPNFPTAQELTRHLSKVAYAQWSIDEVQSGECVKFIEEKMI